MSRSTSARSATSARLTSPPKGKGSKGAKGKRVKDSKKDRKKDAKKHKAKKHKGAKGAARSSKLSPGWTEPAVQALQPVDLATLDCASTPGWSGRRADGEAQLVANGERLSDLQEKLFAHGRTGGTRSVLLVLQGMDTAGKGGVIRHVIGQVDPQGVMLHSFGVPTPLERKHHYLWRVRNALPRPGYVGVFDRSHYEDVLIVRVNQLVPEAVWAKRYDEINAFEEKIAAAGTQIVKVALVISPEEQKARLLTRLSREDKYWKFHSSDVDERAKWPAYREAYQAVLDRTSTVIAPWHVVPADRKWYARLAVSQLLLDALSGLDLAWPPPTFDVAAERARLELT